MQLDDHRLELALLSAVDRSNTPGTRRREGHARVVLVVEKRLTELHLIAFGNHELGPQTDVILADQCDGSNPSRLRYGLPRSALDRYIQALRDFECLGTIVFSHE